MIAHANLLVANRRIDFSLDLDPEHACDRGIIDSMQANKPCEPEVCNVLARILQPGDCAVDGGANVGFLTILMSRLVGETGHVYAFEPGGNNLPKLAANLKLNECENVEVIDKPLSDRWSIPTQLYEHDHPGYNSLWPDLSKQITAKRTSLSTTLDHTCRRLDRVPALIKLDIEGAEMAALRGAPLLLLTKPAIIVELNEATSDRAGYTIADLRDFLHERGYDAFMLFEDGNLPCFIPRRTGIVPSKMNANVLFSTIEEVARLWPEVVI